MTLGVGDDFAGSGFVAASTRTEDLATGNFKTGVGLGVGDVLALAAPGVAVSFAPALGVGDVAATGAATALIGARATSLCLIGVDRKASCV